MVKRERKFYAEEFKELALMTYYMIIIASKYPKKKCSNKENLIWTSLFQKQT